MLRVVWSEPKLKVDQDLSWQVVECREQINDRQETKMKSKLTSGIVCIILAVAFAGVAINNSFFSESALAVGDPSGLGVSRMVGAFLPAVIALAVGIYLLQKPAA